MFSRRGWRRASVTLALVAMLSLGAVACGGDDGSSSEAPSSAAAPAGEATSQAAAEASGEPATSEQSASSPVASAEASTEASAASSEPVTLTWWDYFGYSPESDQAMKDLISKYQDAHPNVTIERTAIAYPDFFTKLNQAVATKKVPDIVAVDAGTIPSYAAQGAFADLSANVDGWDTMSKFLPSVAETVVDGGNTFGVPFRSNALVLWYNEDQFAKAGISGPPATWDDLRADAKALTEGQRAGLCFPGNKTEASTFILLTLIWGAGGDVPTVGDEASVQALEFAKGLVDDGSVPKSVLQWSWDDVASQFAAGNCAMMIAGPWVNGGASEAKFKWTVAEVPKGPAGSNATPLGGEAWTVGANSEHVDAAWQLIDWLSQPENSAKEILVGTQSFPNRTDQTDNPDANWSPIVPTVSAAIGNARTRVAYGPKYNEISTILAGMFQQVLSGQKSPQDAAAEAKPQIEPLLPSS